MPAVRLVESRDIAPYLHSHEQGVSCPMQPIEFNIESMLRGVPGLVRPIVTDFLRSNNIVLGHLLDVLQIPVPSPESNWMAHFVLIATEPQVMLGVFSWQDGELPTELESVHAFVRVSSGPVDTVVARMVSDFRRFAQNAGAK